jgi:hypothetical protein
MKISLLMLLIVTKVFSMEPTPFSNVQHKDPQNNFLVRSVLDKKKGRDFVSTGVTTIYDNKENKIWSANLFTGRRRIELSPDGKTLALIGNFYFGQKIQATKEEVLVELINEAGIIKKVLLSDLYAGDLETLLDQNDIPIIGGGWVSMTQLVPEVLIEWQKKTIDLKCIDGTAHRFSFE